MSQKLLCKDCPHFSIIKEPDFVNGYVVDWGRAECKKYNLIMDFKNHSRFDELFCNGEQAVAEGNDLKTGVYSWNK